MDNSTLFHVLLGVRRIEPTKWRRFRPSYGSAHFCWGMIVIFSSATSQCIHRAIVCVAGVVWSVVPHGRCGREHLPKLRRPFRLLKGQSTIPLLCLMREDVNWIFDVDFSILSRVVATSLMYRLQVWRLGFCSSMPSAYPVTVSCRLIVFVLQSMRSDASLKIVPL